MHTSDEGQMAIISREAIVPSRYYDSSHVATIGVGHTKAAGAPDPQTYTGTMRIADVIALFRRDLVKYESEVSAIITEPLAQHEYDALVSFQYNTGALAGSSIAKALNAGDHQAAGAAFMNFCKPKAIRGRRESERDQFLTGVYPEPFATVYPATPSGAVQWARGQRIDLRPYFKMGASASGVALSAHPVLCRGAGGPEVLALQRALQAKGIGIVADGVYGSATEAAVKAFQVTHALNADGIAGPKTWAALGA